MCSWSVNPVPDPNGPDDSIAYVDLYFEYIYVGGGSLHLSDGDGTELMVFRPAQQALPFPIRSAKPPFNIVWYGLSEGRTSVEFEFGYSAVSFSNLLPQTGAGLRPHSTDNNGTDAEVILHQPFAKIMSPDIDRQLSTLLDYRYLIQGDDRISDTISGPITVMMTSIHFPDRVDNITFYDGATVDSPVICSLTGDEVPNEWITSSGADMMIQLRTDSINTNGYFDFLYLADGQSTACSSMNPYTLEPLSGKFTDGTAANNIERVQTCTWRVKPKGVIPNEIVLYFNRIGIKNFATMQVYDGATVDKSSLLWSCDGCRNVAPPVLRSFKGEFFIRYFSEPAPGPGFYGWEAEYYSLYQNSYGSGDRTMDLHMASANNVEAIRYDATFPLTSILSGTFRPMILATTKYILPSTA